MSKAQADEFRAYARECFELARATSSGTQRQSLLDEAADWLRAATAADGRPITLRRTACEQTSAFHVPIM